LQKIDSLASDDMDEVFRIMLDLQRILEAWQSYSPLAIERMLDSWEEALKHLPVAHLPDDDYAELQSRLAAVRNIRERESTTGNPSATAAQHSQRARVMSGARS